MPRIAYLLLVLCSSSGPMMAWGQLEVATSSVNQLSGVEGLTTIGGVVLFEDASEISIQPGVMIRVTSEAANVEIDVSDRDRRRVAVQRLTDEEGTTVYLVSDPGKFWIDVTAIDFAKNIYRRETGIVIEVPEGSPIGPSPGPPPEPPTEPLLSLVTPISEKLSTDPDKAAAVANAFAGFAAAVAVAMPKDVATFIRVNGDAIRTLKVPPGVAIGAEVDSVLASYVGFELNDDGDWKDRPLTEADRAKLVEAYRAISWSARQ